MYHSSNIKASANDSLQCCVFNALQVPLKGRDELKSSHLVYKGAKREAEAVLRTMGFNTPLRMLQQSMAQSRHLR
jgi:hypothetical protein